MAGARGPREGQRAFYQTTWTLMPLLLSLSTSSLGVWESVTMVLTRERSNARQNAFRLNLVWSTSSIVSLAWATRVRFMLASLGMAA